MNLRTNYSKVLKICALCTLFPACCTNRDLLATKYQILDPNRLLSENVKVNHIIFCEFMSYLMFMSYHLSFFNNIIEYIVLQNFSGHEWLSKIVIWVCTRCVRCAPKEMYQVRFFLRFTKRSEHFACDLGGGIHYLPLFIFAALQVINTDYLITKKKSGQLGLGLQSLAKTRLEYEISSLTMLIFRAAHR